MLRKRRVKVNGLVLSVHEHESVSTSTLILIHGIGVSDRYFVPFANEMAKTHAIKLLDLPGYGDAPKPPRALSIIELAELVTSYIEQTELSHVVLVGHSMGCQIAAQVAKQRPELIDKMILLGPTVNKWERTSFMQLIRLLQDSLREPWAVNKIVFSDYIRMGIGRYVQTSRSMMADVLEETLVRCNTPTLFVRGQKDPITSTKWLNYLAAQVKQGGVREIHGAAHVLQYTKAKDLAVVCSSFIQA